MENGLPCTSDGKESACSTGEPGLMPGLEDLLGKGMATSPVFLSGEFHGQKFLVGYSPCGHKELDMTE